MHKDSSDFLKLNALQQMYSIKLNHNLFFLEKHIRLKKYSILQYLTKLM